MKKKTLSSSAVFSQDFEREILKQDKVACLREVLEFCKVASVFGTLKVDGLERLVFFREECSTVYENGVYFRYLKFDFQA